MKNAIFFLLIIFPMLSLSAQRIQSKIPDFQFGIRTGNHITLPSIDKEDNFRHKSLLRYSAGFIFRRTVYQMKPNRRIGFGAAKRGIIALDMGLNAVFSGYHYEIEGIRATTNRTTWELPLMLVVYDRQNIFLPRKWWRKGITTFCRFGPKLGYMPNQSSSKTIKTDSETVIEKIETGGSNLIWAINGGIIKNHKSGNTTFVEVGWNQGFVPTTSGSLEYFTSSESKQGNFSYRGSYLSVNVGFLLAPKNRKYIPVGTGKHPKTIYNPRFI